MKPCNLPLHGWRCSLPRGHAEPCATLPINTNLPCDHCPEPAVYGFKTMWFCTTHWQRLPEALR